MAGATNRKEAIMLDDALDVDGYSIALYTTMPNENGTGGQEVLTTGGTNYARRAIDGDPVTDWEPAVPGDPSTKAGPRSGVSWDFNAPGANWGNVKGFGLVDASGNIDFLGLLPVPKDINAGEPAPVFNASHQITVQLGDPGDNFS